MRRPVIIAFLVFVIALILLGVNYFFPILTPDGTTNIPYLILTAIIAALTLVTGYYAIIALKGEQPGKGVIKIDEKQAKRNRENMLQLVWNTWIEGVLHKSLYNEMRIELGMETRPDAIDHPWDMVFHMPDQEPKLVPPGTTILELFDNANGALLILGGPGSGKTTILLELAKQAIIRARKDTIQQIPVVLKLSSWTPKETFTEWLVEELQRKYFIPQKISRDWVEGDELILLLDGLDEVRAVNREECVKVINSFREEHNVALVICSCVQEYLVLETRLKLWSAVFIQTLNNDQVYEYLEKAGGKFIVLYQSLNRHIEQGNSRENEQVFLRTPLFLSILVLAFSNVPTDKIMEFEKANSYQKLLYDTYIKQMFKRYRGNPEYSPSQTKQWLSWLAKKMIDKAETQFFIEDINLSWTQLSEMKSRRVSDLIVGLLTGLIAGLMFGLIFGTNTGVLGVLIFGLMAGRMNRQSSKQMIGTYVNIYDPRTVDKLHWSWKAY